jgi:type VI secretion system FHA domain protein
VTRPQVTPFSNNPFRTSRSVEEALQRLFAARSQRCLPPVEAVRASFADLQKHEHALRQGLEQALAAYLVRFSPETLEEQFAGTMERVGVSPDDKTKYWEMYAEMFRVLAQPGADGLPPAFAEVFAEAYANQAPEPGTRLSG